MKLLVAVESSENAGKLSKSTLRWVSRGGFKFLLFIPDKNQLEAYVDAVRDAEHEEYLDMKNCIVPAQTAESYARQNGYELLLSLPDDLKAWNKSRDKDKMIIEYAVDVGRARQSFAKSKRKRKHDFTNGARMIRL